jgi:hypothetical protein
MVVEALRSFAKEKEVELKRVHYESLSSLNIMSFIEKNHASSKWHEKLV